VKARLAPTTLFGFPHAVPEAFEESSVYIFYLRDGGPGAAAPPPEVPLALAHQLGIQAKAEAGTGRGGFRPNIVVTRRATQAPLATYVEEQRRYLLSQQEPRATLLQDAPCTVAGFPGHAMTLALASPALGLDLQQWIVLTLRDGFAYAFFGTTTRSRYDTDQPHFRGFVSGWR